MNQRMKDISDAATRLFLRQGYSKTQISHIARAVGVSVGTIYLDFTGKKEILHFILKGTIEPEFLDHEFERPVTDELFIGLEDQIIALFEKSGESFASHLSNGAADYRFEELISDAFDLLSRYAVGCLFIEKNQLDFPKLAAAYRTYRQSFLDTMTQYLSAFIAQGSIRPLEQLPLTTTLIIEMLSWWAMDVRYTSFETQNVPAELAKKICLDNLIAAYKKQD